MVFSTHWPGHIPSDRGKRRRSLGSHWAGGEREMVAIDRALMTDPGLPILDEATESPTPVIGAEPWAVLVALNADGQSILPIDKNLPAVLRFGERPAVIEK